ncbi:hypothetical protein EYF80_052081 [Liparis tanakae]|uniref:Uncharacterized protein n=1 Tax=Liparis tanakae TaxID=230148 RepID=A0A4Z2FAF2_9TELE|nr:hypothetical protein EYF80_052081 [Liparis tanakae]
MPTSRLMSRPASSVISMPSPRYFFSAFLERMEAQMPVPRISRVPSPRTPGDLSRFCLGDTPPLHLPSSLQKCQRADEPSHAKYGC